MKALLLFALFIFASTSIFAQSKYGKLQQWYKEKKSGESNVFQKSLENPLILQIDSTLVTRNDALQMPTLIPNKSMSANMPNMPIRQDINYTMRIKKYELCYPYSGSLDSLRKPYKSKTIPLLPE
jgi:hypothetical protein